MTRLLGVPAPRTPMEQRLDDGAGRGSDPAHRRTDEPADEQRDVLQDLYDHAPCGYLTTDPDGTVTRVNQTFLSWSGYRADQVVGHRLQSLLPVGDRILYMSHCMPQLGTAGAVAEVLLRIRGADGEERPALISATRRPADDGSPAVDRVVVFAAHGRERYEQELVAAVRRAEQSETHRAAAEERMRRLAMHDPLTGLLNRAGLAVRMSELSGADRAPSGRSLGVLFVDLDEFKSVNDSLGHFAGDQLLGVIAARLREAVPDTAVLARLSGDEFVAVHRFADGAQAAELARRLLQSLAAPVMLQGLELVPGASVGAAVAETDDDTFDDLLRHADAAMYRAKALGRNRVELHDPRRADAAFDRLRLLGELRRAIEDDQLVVYYQPRVDLHTGALSGAEALVRWQHPTRGLLPPSEFIEAAEQSGLVRPLGAWVLDAAVRQAVQWNAAGGVPLRMAVNLSTRQLSDPELVATVIGALRRHGLAPELLTLEVTETALMVDPDVAQQALRALKALGVQIAVDDFGTGYASLTYLQRFPIDELKIDRSFVAGLGASQGDSVIVATCVQLAHALGLQAVAEGVETDAQRQALLELDCDLAQGYFYARPLPADDFAPWAGAAPADDSGASR